MAKNKDFTERGGIYDIGRVVEQTISGFRCGTSVLSSKGSFGIVL